jgi:hypothetical protein
MAANTLTDLIPSLYNAADTVANELVGLIPSVTMNSSAEMVAKDQVIRIPKTSIQSLVAITPGVAPADGAGQSIGYDDVKITKSYMVPIPWNGEEQKGFSSNGTYNTVLAQQAAQAMRALNNQVESDLADLMLSACRAAGTPGTTPFASAFSDSAQVAKILDDNGAPQSDRTLVLNTTAAANLSTLLKGNFTGGGSSDSLRGVLLNLDNMNIRKSAQIKSEATASTANTAYVIDGTGNLAKGSTTLKLKTGSGTILAGAIMTIKGRQYVAKTALAATLVTIAEPGIMDTLVDGDTVGVSKTNLYVANMAFSRDAIHLIARQPAMPEGGDSATDVTLVTSPISGLSYQVAMYRQYRQIRLEIGLAWGVACPKPSNLCLLLG